jgi:hypothetical protein
MIALYRDLHEVGNPTSDAIRWLLGRGVTIAALGDFGAEPELSFAFGAARVSFHPTGRCRR